MPNIQGVILIDVWDDPGLEDFYQDAVQRISGFDIKCCVNASYNLDLRMLAEDLPDRSLSNTFRYHFWNRAAETQPEYHPSQHPSDRLINNVVRFSRSTRRTSPILAVPDLLNSDASVVILDINDLVYHCNTYHNNSIQNWLVIGQSWRQCVHFRPLGLHALSTLIKKENYNIYVTPWSVLDAQQKQLDPKCFKGNDGISWEPVEDFGYRLAGRITDK